MATKSIFKSIFYKIDLFAPHYEFEIRKNDTRYSTMSGGLFSIFSIAISIIYAIYQLYLWINGQYIPLITTLDKIQDLNQLKLDNIISAQVRLSNFLGVFTQEQLQDIFDTIDIGFSKGNQYYIELDKIRNDTYIEYTLNQTLIQNYTIEDIQYSLIQFLYCRNGNGCDSKLNKKMEHLMQLGLVASIEFQLFHYNYEENKVQAYNKQLNVILSLDRVIISQVEYTLTQSNIDFGYPFGLKTNELLYMSDCQIIETNLGKFCLFLLTKDQNQSYFSILFTKAILTINIKMNERVRYQKIQHQSLTDRIILIASFFRLFISIGAVTFKTQARKNLLKRINKNIIKNQQIQDNFEIIHEFQNKEKRRSINFQDCDQNKNILNQNIKALFKTQLEQIIFIKTEKQNQNKQNQEINERIERIVKQLEQGEEQKQYLEEYKDFQDQEYNYYEIDIENQIQLANQRNSQQQEKQQAQLFRYIYNS